MAEILYRTAGPVTVEPGGDGLTVIGMAAPYGEVTEVLDNPEAGPYFETYDEGAFAGVIDRWPAHKLKVQLEHPTEIGQGGWVGRGQEWRDSPEGLRVALRLDDTHDGHAAAFKVRDGQLPAMSLAFVPGHSPRVFDPDLGAEVTHRRVVRAITHLALVPDGAYRGALVEAVRSAASGLDADPPPTPRLDTLQEWLATLRQ